MQASKTSYGICMQFSETADIFICASQMMCVTTETLANVQVDSSMNFLATQEFTAFSKNLEL